VTKLVRYLAALLALFVLWHLASLLLGERVLPSPWLVFQNFLYELGNAAFWKHVAASSGRAVSALFLSFALAFPLGIWLGACRRADAWLSPMVFITYPIPKILFLPVLLVLFGLGEAPKILLIALTAGYQILVVTRDSVRNLDRRYLDSFASLSLDSAMLLRHVLAPAALPAAVSSLRIATGTAIAVLFMAESFVTDTGLGFFIIDAWGGMDLPRMFTGIIAMSLVGLVLYEACNALDYCFCRWVRL